MRFLSRFLVILAAAAMAGSAGYPQSARAVEQTQILGREIPLIELTDDSGRTRSARDWKGTPTILVPIYTRCPSACLLTTVALKRAVQRSNATPGSYRVVLFSFDSRDTPADLRSFRERQGVPLAWTLATARTSEIRRLMDTIGFRYADANGQFAHPNVAVALTPELKTAKYLAGTRFEGSDIDEAIRIAGGGRDWLAGYGGWALAGLLLTCTLSGIYALTLLTSR